MTTTNGTPDQAELQPAARPKLDEPLALQDVTNRLEHLTESLMLYVNDEHISPQAQPRWIAGRSVFAETIELEKHEHRPRRRLAYLWLLDALLAEPDVVIAAVQAARDELVAPDEALKPFAE